MRSLYLYIVTAILLGTASLASAQSVAGNRAGSGAGSNSEEIVDDGGSLKMSAPPASQYPQGAQYPPSSQYPRPQQGQVVPVPNQGGAAPSFNQGAPVAPSVSGPQSNIP